MKEQFTWIPIYNELARKLLSWKDRQGELIEFLKGLLEKGYKVTALTDQDDEGARFPLKEIDPFTFFGVFNRGIREDQRLLILKEIIQFFGMEGNLPNDFAGVPVLNNQRSWFFSYQAHRKPDDIQKLWKVFELGLKEKPFDDPEFLHAFDEALTVRMTNLNLTMGLFWIRPDTFLNLDRTNRQFLNIKLPSTGLSAEYYSKVVSEALAKGKPFPQLSYEAWLAAIKPDVHVKKDVPQSEIEYWMVGAYWPDNDPPDLTKHFLDEGIWQNRHKDHYLEEVRSMRVGDKIAVKSTSTQKHNLPFESGGKTASRMTIKARGTIVANRGDGRVVEVEWDTSFEEKVWFFYTYQRAVWRLRRENELAKRLIDFAFEDVEQDYQWFLEHGWADSEGKKFFDAEVADAETARPYNLADLLASGVFIEEVEIKQALERLQSKKNLILQGPPGVGKTFIARKLAYTLMEARDDDRIEMVQFHQSYSYEDFIRGYRPLEEKAGVFGLRDGVFHMFCKKVKDDPDRPYVFIIDEINRGNLSQIFGELLMLVEADKRGPEFSLPLVYRKPDEPRFFVPDNLYLIGLMNLADRSLAMVDYALRRRFAFMTLKPQYESDRFRSWLHDRSMPDDLIKLIIERITTLNRDILEDRTLGENYQLGHSFFCPKGDNFAELDRSWYEGIINFEILPLLKEYWYDNPKRAEQAREGLLAP